MTKHQISLCSVSPSKFETMRKGFKWWDTHKKAPGRCGTIFFFGNARLNVASLSHPPAASRFSRRRLVCTALESRVSERTFVSFSVTYEFYFSDECSCRFELVKIMYEYGGANLIPLSFYIFLIVSREV